MSHLPEFHLECIASPQGTHVKLRGELDSFAASSFDAALQNIESSHPDILVLDLREVVLLDSTGIRSLLGVARRAKENGRRVGVVRGPEPVQAVFRICGIEQFFDLADHPKAWL